MDLWPFDVRRFSSHQANRHYLAERSSEAYGDYYSIHWPAAELQSARGARRSPLYDALKARGAVYGSKAGWERPLWFDTRRDCGVGNAELRGQAGLVRCGRARASRGARERRALRPDLVLQIRGARAWSARGAAADRGRQSRPAGRQLRLHAALQRAGRHRGRPHHHAACGGSFLCRDRQPVRRARFRWIRRHLPDGRFSRDCRGDLGLCGDQHRRAARARILQATTDDDLSNAAFPVPLGRGRSRSGLGAPARRASAMSASLAGSCTSRPSMRRTSTSG